MKTIVFSLIVLLFASCSSHYEYAVEYVYSDSVVREVNNQVLTYGSGNSNFIFNVNNNHNVKIKNNSSGKELLSEYEIRYLKKTILNNRGVAKEGLNFVAKDNEKTFIPFERMSKDLKKTFFNLRAKRLYD